MRVAVEMCPASSDGIHNLLTGDGYTRCGNCGFIVASIGQEIEILVWGAMVEDGRELIKAHRSKQQAQNGRVA